MNKERGLVQKLKQFVGSLKLPKHFNKKGPKKYTVQKHLLAWLIKQVTKNVYRLNAELCCDLGVSEAHFTTLGKAIKHFPKWVIDKLGTFESDEPLVALDATGIERSSASRYYHWRINSEYKTKKCIKLSILIGIRSKHILRCHVRAKPRHDVIDAEKLIGACRNVGGKGVVRA